jgi:hypothetical protein
MAWESRLIEEINSASPCELTASHSEKFPEYFPIGCGKWGRILWEVIFSQPLSVGANPTSLDDPLLNH